MRLGDYASIPAALNAQIQLRPAATCMVFMDDGGDPRQVTCGELQAAIAHTAAVLKKNGVIGGDLVVLAFNHTWELIPAFLGAIYIGAVPVILPYLGTISASSLQRQMQGLISTWQPRAILAMPQNLPELAGFVDETICTILPMPEQFENQAGLSEETKSSPDNVPDDSARTAYLQLSSGTTSAPKAVMITHQALLNSVQAMLDAWELTEQDVSTGWLPLHHDMGLIFEVLTPLLGGFLSVLIAPDYWVRHPQSLLQAVSRYRGTWTGMPNFAFNHCVRSIRSSELAGLDLSSWRLLLNGAELVYPESLQMFYERFAVLGLRHEALRAVYGMTENVGAICMTPPISAGDAWLADWVVSAALLEQAEAVPAAPESPQAHAVINCGRLLPGNELMVVDEQGARLADRQVGEIWLRSHSLCPAYYRVEGSIPNPDGWFATGDIGYLVAGELFICDRKKDLIISAGNHIFPGVIESIGLTVLEERAGGMAAFGVVNPDLGTELPVLVCEVRGKHGETEHTAWATKISQRVRTELNIALSDIRFVRRGWLVQTTSAKINRSACRKKYLAEFFSETNEPNAPLAQALSERPKLPAPYAAPFTELEKQVAAIWADLLNLKQIGLQDNFFDLGGDSLNAMRMTIEVERQLKQTVPEIFYQQPTLANLVQLLSGHPSIEKPAASPGRVAARIPRRMSWLDRLIFHGPLLRGHALPYALGIHLQRLWLAFPGVRRMLFRAEINTLRQWGEWIGCPPDENALVQSLLTNTWRNWRNRVLAVPFGSSPWVRVAGDPALWQSASGGQGKIYLVLHSPLTDLFIKICKFCGMDPIFIPYLTRETHQPIQDRAVVVDRAYRKLLQGGVVIIAGDGQSGSQGVRVPFWGGEWLFRQGGAELALQADAQLIPVFLCMSANGQVQIEFCEPLKASAGKMQAQAHELTRDYANLVVERWPKIYSSISWKKLQRMLKVLLKGQ